MKKRTIRKLEIQCIWGAINALLAGENGTDTKIEDLERTPKAVDDRRIEAEMRADKQDEVIGRLVKGIENPATGLIDLEARVKAVESIVEGHSGLHNMGTDLFKSQSNTLEDLRAKVSGLVADKDQLTYRSASLSQRVDKLQTEVDDKAKALEHLAEGVESVAKGMVSLEGWMSAVETILSSLRK